MTTNEKNRMIAEFMGASYVNGLIEEYPKIPNGCEVWGNDIDRFLKYHESWEWLMPVVEKIASIKHEDYRYDVIKGFGTYWAIVQFKGRRVAEKWESVTPYKDDLGNGRTTQGTHLAPTSIEGLYIAITRFIKWYTTQQKEAGDE